MEENKGECEVVEANETMEIKEDDKPDNKMSKVTSIRRNIFQRQVSVFSWKGVQAKLFQIDQK